MEEFSIDFELKRIIFGLCSIIKTPENILPQIVSEKLPEIMNQLSLLAKKMQTERLERLQGTKDEIEESE